MFDETIIGVYGTGATISLITLATGYWLLSELCGLITLLVIGHLRETGGGCCGPWHILAGPELNTLLDGALLTSSGKWQYYATYSHRTPSQTIEPLEFGSHGLR